MDTIAMAEEIYEMLYGTKPPDCRPKNGRLPDFTSDEWEEYKDQVHLTELLNYIWAFVNTMQEIGYLH